MTGGPGSASSRAHLVVASEMPRRARERFVVSGLSSAGCVWGRGWALACPSTASCGPGRPSGGSGVPSPSPPGGLAKASCLQIKAHEVDDVVADQVLTPDGVAYRPHVIYGTQAENHAVERGQDIGDCWC